MAKVVWEKEVPDDVVQAIKLAHVHGDLYARIYVDAMQEAYDRYGIEGLKVQVLYVLGNLEEWRDRNSGAVKRTLRKWATTKE